MQNKDLILNSNRTFRPSPPISEKELMQRANVLGGLTFAQIAEVLEVSVPQDLRRNKGWVGNLIELALGATAGSRAEPDFPKLGIELKTLPIDRWGTPMETTFVCLAPLNHHTGVTWETSHLRNKLRKVLWVLVQKDPAIPLAQRRVVRCILWEPDKFDEQCLRSDWEELMEYITMGRFSEINGDLGTFLQLRPKAANSRERTLGYGEDGKLIATKPLGFYLRTVFTHRIIINYFFR